MIHNKYSRKTRKTKKTRRTRKILMRGGGGTNNPKIKAMKASNFSVKTKGTGFGFSSKFGMSNAEYKQHQLRKEIKKHSGANWGRLDQYMNAIQKKADAKKLSILKEQQTLLGHSISPETQQRQLSKAEAIQKHYNSKKIEELKRVIDVAEARAKSQGITLAPRPVIAYTTDVASHLQSLKAHADDIKRRIASHHLAENTNRLQIVADAKAKFVNAIALRDNYLRTINTINQLGKQLKMTKNATEAMQIKQQLITLDGEKKKLKGQVNAISSSDLRRLRNEWQRLDKEFGKKTLSGKQAKLQMLERGLPKDKTQDFEEFISRERYKRMKQDIQRGNTRSLLGRQQQLTPLLESTASKLKPLSGAVFTQEAVEKMSDRVLQEAIEHFELQPNMKALSERLRQEKRRREQLRQIST